MQLLEPIQSTLDSIQGEYAQYKREVIKDFWICLISRECSIIGRKEVLTGKAKFGILGDGKEVPQEEIEEIKRGVRDRIKTICDLLYENSDLFYVRESEYKVIRLSAEGNEDKIEE